MKRKWLAVGIILLFVGVTIAPTINFNTVKASQEDDLVEVTTQACGIKGFGNTTVKLTREQYHNLEQYLVEFRERLNQTTTKVDAVPLFKEAVVELDKYGLLPRGMSVETAQKLVSGTYQNMGKLSKFQNDVNRTLDNEQRQDLFPDYINVFCLLYADFIPGEHRDILDLSGLFLLTLFLGYYLLPDSPELFGISLILLVLGMLSPLKLVHLMAFKDYYVTLTSFGLNGVVRMSRNNLLLLGFTGMLIKDASNTRYLLGSCFVLDEIKE